MVCDKMTPEESKLLDFFLSSSVLLRKLGKDGYPVRNAAGCLLDYKGRRWVLTVSYATGDMGDWRIELEYIKGEGLKNHPIGAMHFASVGDLSVVLAEKLDLAYAEVPSGLQPLRQFRNPQGEIEKTLLCVIFDSDLNFMPSNDRSYAFAGTVMPAKENHFGRIYQSSEFRFYGGLELTGEDKQFYYFKLPFAHPGHEHFKGTSGAPICDIEGNIAALVCGPGPDGTDTIRGIKMAYFRTLLDVTVLDHETQGAGKV
jgi:hypothetical protein